MGIKVLLAKFSTTINKQVSFACPISSSDTSEFEVRHRIWSHTASELRLILVDRLQALLKALGISISSLASLL